jgi:hypothetical protein
MRAAFFPCIGVILASALLGGIAPALAQGGQGVVPLDRLLPEIRRNHPGQFYDADGPSPGPDGLLHYHLKWMTPDGRIEWLDADARTGRILGASPGRDTFDRPAPGPQAPDYRGRFEGGDDRFFPRRGQDYGNGRDDNGRDRGEGRRER